MHSAIQQTESKKDQETAGSRSVGMAPIFIAMTRQMEATERKAIVTRAVMIAFTVTLFFLLAARGEL